MNIKTSKFFVFSSISVFILAVFFSQCIQSNAGKPDIRGQAYADPKTCIKCHKETYQSYLQTGHYHTSSVIQGNKLQNDVKPDTNVFVYSDSVKIRMDKRKNGLYQTALFHDTVVVRSERFDVALGSNTRAQTYGYWNGNKLYELPISYFQSIHNWAVSPGFHPAFFYYKRAIVTRCLECHASYAESHYVETNGIATQEEEYTKNSLIYGIDCQRCHGPAAEHVNYHLKNPGEKAAHFIRTYQSLTRDQKIQQCAVCHSGNDLEVQKSTFLYKPGDTLSHFLEPDFGDKAGANKEPDVHGSQAKLLALSKCYLKSATLTCTTCHDTHKKETADMVTFSNKCMSCHKTETHNFCKMAPELGNAINSKCIDCHMPALVSNKISFKMTNAKTTSHYLLHTHKIAIYPDKTQEILALIKNSSTKL